jgi:hypothetical protein
MMTWGISDFVDEKGESDGKFSMSLNFPNEDYKTDGTDVLLEKLKDFENQILDDAVKYSDAWFGEDLSREVVKHNFFPFLKYSKDKLTKKVDFNKPPAIRAKVPCYNGKWNVEIYDTQQNLIFPSEDEALTPMDFVPKLSNVACVLQCGGLWFGGKGWGLTWKLNQVVVKPREVVSVFGKCQINLSVEDIATLEHPSMDDAYAELTDKKEQATTNVEVVDSDDDEPVETTTESAADIVDSEDDEPVPPPTPKKKVIKKEVIAVEAPIPTPKKKVIKKKVVA